MNHKENSKKQTPTLGETVTELKRTNQMSEIIEKITAEENERKAKIRKLLLNPYESEADISHNIKVIHKHNRYILRQAILATKQLEAEMNPPSPISIQDIANDVTLQKDILSDIVYLDKHPSEFEEYARFININPEDLKNFENSKKLKYLEKLPKTAMPKESGWNILNSLPHHSPDEIIHRLYTTTERYAIFKHDKQFEEACEKYGLLSFESSSHQEQTDSMPEDQFKGALEEYKLFYRNTLSKKENEIRKLCREITSTWDRNTWRQKDKFPINDKLYIVKLAKQTRIFAYADGFKSLYTYSDSHQDFIDMLNILKNELNDFKNLLVEYYNSAFSSEPSNTSLISELRKKLEQLHPFFRYNNNAILFILDKIYNFYKIDLDICIQLSSISTHEFDQNPKTETLKTIPYSYSKDTINKIFLPIFELCNSNSDSSYTNFNSGCSYILDSFINDWNSTKRIERNSKEYNRLIQAQKENTFLGSFESILQLAYNTYSPIFYSGNFTFEQRYYYYITDTKNNYIHDKSLLLEQVPLHTYASMLLAENAESDRAIFISTSPVNAFNYYSAIDNLTNEEMDTNMNPEQTNDIHNILSTQNLNPKNKPVEIDITDEENTRLTKFFPQKLNFSLNNIQSILSGYSFEQLIMEEFMHILESKHWFALCQECNKFFITSTKNQKLCKHTFCNTKRLAKNQEKYMKNPISRIYKQHNDRIAKAANSENNDISIKQLQKWRTLAKPIRKEFQSKIAETQTSVETDELCQNFQQRLYAIEKECHIETKAHTKQAR